LEGLGHEVRVLEISESAAGAGEGAVPQLPVTYGPWRGWRERGYLREILDTLAPDIVHLHSPYTVMSPVVVAELRARRPTVATLHDVRPFCFLGTRRFGPTGAICDRTRGIGCVTTGCYHVQSLRDVARIPRRLMVESWSLREWQRLPYVIVVSRYLKALAVQHGFDSQRIEVIPNFMSSYPEAVSSTRNTVPLILFAGRLVGEKGVFLLLDALYILRDYQWHAEFLGDGPARQALVTRADELGLSERTGFVGHVDEAARDEKMRRMDVLVLPAIIAEGFGAVGMEAMFFGKPVVSFGLGGSGDWLIDGVTGLVAEDGNVEDLAHKIRALLEDPEWGRQLGRRGRELAEREFQSERCVRRIQETYLRAMGE